MTDKAEGGVAAARGAVLAIEAGRTIVVDQAAVIDLANRHGIAIVAVEGIPHAPS